MPWKCPVCGNINDDDVDVCPQCGTLRESLSQPQDTSKDSGAEQPQAQQVQQNRPPVNDTQSAPQNPVSTPQASSSQLKLIYKKNGQMTNQEITISGSSAIVGRFDPSTGPVDIDLSGFEEGAYVSRNHAKLYKDDTKNVWYVEDLGSSNGTYLNRKKLEKNKPAELKKGDKLSFGNMKFIIDV
ncbi:FHA domain-containing protein [Mesoaciditoga lauensis]|uniref:FHA domain-containing protein n=1 Tax=Mesoaciditoga lauensis TaxID=1495039 RepID=UPI00068F972D|nr:FHA domain-containing protein [Mesoaciditoga lauensis]